MAGVMTIDFALVKRYLKMSKSVQQDDGPYSAQIDSAGDWYCISNRYGSTVAQIPTVTFETMMRETAPLDETATIHG